MDPSEPLQSDRKRLARVARVACRHGERFAGDSRGLVTGTESDWFAGGRDSARVQTHPAGGHFPGTLRESMTARGPSQGEASSFRVLSISVGLLAAVMQVMQVMQ